MLPCWPLEGDHGDLLGTTLCLSVELATAEVGAGSVNAGRQGGRARVCAEDCAEPELRVGGTAESEH